LKFAPTKAPSDAEDARKPIFSCKTSKVMSIATVEEEVEKAVKHASASPAKKRSGLTQEPICTRLRSSKLAKTEPIPLLG